MAGDPGLKYRLSAFDGLSRVLNGASSAFSRLKQKTGAANSAFKKLGKISSGVGTGFRKVMKGATSIATLGAGLIAAPVTALTGLSLKKFAEYEKALIGVGKTSNLSGKELQELGSQFRQLSKRMPDQTTELLGLGQVAAQLGVHGTKNILKFAETVSRLDSASDLQGEEAASALATILNVTQEGPENVDRLASSFVALGNNFNTTEAKLADFANEVGRGIAVYGASSAQIAGIGAAFSSVGVKAEAGGTVITTAFQQINKAVRQGGKPLYELSKITGKTKDEITQIFKKDSTAAFEVFIKGLGRIVKSGGDVDRALERFGLTGARVGKVLPVMGKNSEILSKALNMSSKAFKENVALTEESDRSFNAPGSRYQMFKNRVTDAFVSIGQSLEAPAGGVLKDLSAFLDHAESSGGFKKIGGVIASNFAEFKSSLSEIFGVTDKAQALTTAITTIDNATKLFFGTLKLGASILKTFNDLFAIFEDGFMNGSKEIAQGAALSLVGDDYHQSKGEIKGALAGAKMNPEFKAFREKNKHLPIRDAIEKFKDRENAGNPIKPLHMGIMPTTADAERISAKDREAGKVKVQVEFKNAPAGMKTFVETSSDNVMLDTGAQAAGAF